MTTNTPPQRKRERANWRPRYLDSDELQRRRKEAGLKQAELAAMIPTDPRHLSHWEAGDYGPGVEIIIDIAAALPDCKATDLMHEDGRALYAELIKALSSAA